MSAFYMTLPSNSSMNYYPENTLSNYVTKLPQLFDLDGSWEVGLSEILFPISWPTVREDEVTLDLLVWKKNMVGQFESYDWVNVSPPPGHYASPADLVKQINANIERVEYRKNLARFSFNEISKKITIRFDEKALQETMIDMSSSLAELLGFEWETIVSPAAEERQPDDDASRQRRQVVDEFRNYKLQSVEDSGKRLRPANALSYTASHVCDLNRGFYSLYVYCSIVEPVVVGDVMAPLIRVVNIGGKEGTFVSRIYQNIQYVPIQTRQFDTVEIDIRNDAGEKISFERGKVVTVLHFRRRKPSYL